MRNKIRLLAILINLAILVCCITPCIVADNLTNNISDRLDEMPFYNAAIHEHQPLQFDHKFLRDDFNHTKIIREQHLTPEHKLKKLSVSEKGASKSNYTFSLHGNVKLLWSYVNDKKDAEVEFDTLDDVNGDGIEDILLSDCNAENKLLVMSGKDGSVIWSKNYPTKIEIEELDDVNEDGVEEAIVFWDEYDSISNQTTIIIELLSGSNGEKIRSKKIGYEGEYCHIGVHGTDGDISEDGTEDILIEAWSWELTVVHALNSKDFSTLWKRTFNGYACGYYWAWNDLTGDGIYDFAVSSYNRNNNVGKLFIIRGSDGYVEWHKLFIGDVGYPEKNIDFDRDGLPDVSIVNNDDGNKTGKIFILKGTDGSVIWSKSFNYSVWWRLGSSDFNGDGVEEQCLKLENFTTGRIEEVQVLSGIDGSLIWKKSVNISQVGHSNDLNRDGKSDLLFSNSREIGKNKYLYDVIAISGVDGSVIWKSSFSHDIKIEIPESEHWYEWSYPNGWTPDLNGDGITDPLLDVGCWCWCAYRECDTRKLILINGKDGSEIWDVECTADDDILLSTRTWIDFNNDGIKDEPLEPPTKSF